MMHKIEFESIFSGTCVQCHTGLVNKPMHFTDLEYIDTSIGGYILNSFHSRINAECRLGDCSIRVDR